MTPMTNDDDTFTTGQPSDLLKEFALHIPSPAMSAEESRVAYKTIETSLRELWTVVDNLSALLPRRRTYYRVTIFGSSRMSEGDELYGEARRLASQLAGKGMDIITGGGPGIMQAANEGARLGDKAGRIYSFGLNVDLPHEQDSNPYVEKLFQHGTFFSRLHHFVQLSSAFVVMPGGIGTTLEALMVWQLAQVGRLPNRPLIFVGDMWRELVDWGSDNWVEGRWRLADPGDTSIPVCVDTVDEAVEVIEANVKWWQETAEEAVGEIADAVDEAADVAEEDAEELRATAEGLRSRAAEGGS